MTQQCTFDGCDKEIHGRGLCGSHLQQQRRGTILHPLSERQARGCDFPGCERNHYAFGLCEAHRDQQRRGKPLTPIQVRAPRPPGAPPRKSQAEHCLHCDRKPKAHDLCSTHLSEADRRAKGIMPKGQTGTLKSKSRVTPGKDKRNDKPKWPTNPNLPRNWERLTDKTPPPYVQKSGIDDLAIIGPVKPMRPCLAELMRIHLSARDLLDLAEMLGVSEMAMADAL